MSDPGHVICEREVRRRRETAAWNAFYDTLFEAAPIADEPKAIRAMKQSADAEWREIHPTMWERRVGTRLLRVIQRGPRLFESIVYHGGWTMTGAFASRRGAQRGAERLIGRVGTKNIR